MYTATLRDSDLLFLGFVILHRASGVQDLTWDDEKGNITKKFIVVKRFIKINQNLTSIRYMFIYHIFISDEFTLIQ